jgi:hypothetical protein
MALIVLLAERKNTLDKLVLLQQIEKENISNRVVKFLATKPPIPNNK